MEERLERTEVDGCSWKTGCHTVNLGHWDSYECGGIVPFKSFARALACYKHPLTSQNCHSIQFQKKIQELLEKNLNVYHPLHGFCSKIEPALKIVCPGTPNTTHFLKTVELCYEPHCATQKLLAMCHSQSLKIWTRMESSRMNPHSTALQLLTRMPRIYLQGEKCDLPSRWCWIPPNMKMKSGPYSIPYIDQHKNVLKSQI